MALSLASSARAVTSLLLPDWEATELLNSLVHVWSDWAGGEREEQSKGKRWRRLLVQLPPDDTNVPTRHSNIYTIL
ncbi:hypothetical protein RR46_07641 [Papilio xuthus]|uniref:Uncharacterized protein n=1 Tax=Papilio xuthus TaxID=66420 RepID=A0A194Q5H6_PAPXU|nr:hypothetical protein RR46_07641 [Papilio xuthus]